MAMVTPLPVTIDQVFPARSVRDRDVEPVRDFDAKGSAPVQKRDKSNGCRCGRCRCMTGPDAKGPAKSVKVVLLDERQPVPPPALDGLPFRPVEFDGVTVTPYVAEGAGRRGWRTRSRPVMRAPAGRPGPKGRGRSPSGHRGGAGLRHPAAPASSTEPAARSRGGLSWRYSAPATGRRTAGPAGSGYGTRSG